MDRLLDFKLRVIHCQCYQLLMRFIGPQLLLYQSCGLCLLSNSLTLEALLLILFEQLLLGYVLPIAHINLKLILEKFVHFHCLSLLKFKLRNY